MNANQDAGERSAPAAESQTALSPAAEAGGAGSHTGRKFAVGALIVLGLILLAAGSVLFWARFTLLNTHGWVSAVGPLSKDPATAGIISQYVVGELFAHQDVEGSLADALPPKMQPLSKPLTSGIEHIVGGYATQLVSSDAFHTVWVDVNRIGHFAVMRALKGKGDKLYMQDGKLTLDLSDATTFLENKLGPLDLGIAPASNGGKLVLFENQQVADLQQIVSAVNILGLLAPLLGILAFAAAMYVSLWRRETLLWIGIGLAAAMLLSLIVFFYSSSNILVNAAEPVLRDLGTQIIHVVTQSLYSQTIFLMLTGILIAIAAWKSDPDSA